MSSQISLLPPVVVDEAGFGSNFADVTQQPNKQYNAGDVVVVKFVGANPRNNRRSTFLTVTFQDKDGKEVIRYTDAHWETQFHWKRNGIAESTVTIMWSIPENEAPGMYRITYNCDHKSLFGGVSTTSGTTSWFQVSASSAKLDKLRLKQKFYGRKKENEVKKGKKNLYTNVLSKLPFKANAINAA